MRTDLALRVWGPRCFGLNFDFIPLRSFMLTYKIGIDVGGTNTDAVLIDEHCKVIQQR